MKHKGKITISRPQCSDGSEYISITINDDDAGIEFLSIEMTYADFTKAITGQGGIPFDFTARGLNNVGKRIIRDNIEFPMPEYKNYSDRNRIATIEANRLIKDGWTASTYFGSQDSFSNRDGIEYAKTGIYKWVEKKEVTS